MLKFLLSSESERRGILCVTSLLEIRITFCANWVVVVGLSLYAPLHPWIPWRPLCNYLPKQRGRTGSCNDIAHVRPYVSVPNSNSSRPCSTAAPQFVTHLSFYFWIAVQLNVSAIHLTQRPTPLYLTPLTRDQHQNFLNLFRCLWLV